MTNKIILSWNDITLYASLIADQLKEHGWTVCKIYGFPRGGVYAAQAIQSVASFDIILTETPEEADIIVDDIIDSGATKVRCMEKYVKPFFALVDKLAIHQEWKGIWVSFPWERMNNEDSPVENVRRLLEYIGEDPDREGLIETPQRVIKSYQKLFGGYNEDPKEYLKVFKDDTCDEMVVVKEIEVYSMCEHHMLPFFGKAHIAYVPDGKVVGVSKLVRILETYARRLQIQERLCQQVTETIDKLLSPKGSACIIQARHFCMTSRGVEKQNSVMVTSSLTGVFQKHRATRNELLSLIKGD